MVLGFCVRILCTTHRSYCVKLVGLLEPARKSPYRPIIPSYAGNQPMRNAGGIMVTVISPI